VLFSGSVCPKEVFPPAEKLLFCTTAFTAEYDSRAAIDFIKETKGANIKLGLGAMAIPISRGGIDFAEDYAKKLGMNVVEKQIIPPNASDYLPFATKINSTEPAVVYSWAPWTNQIRTIIPFPLDSVRPGFGVRSILGGHHRHGHTLCAQDGITARLRSGGNS